MIRSRPLREAFFVAIVYGLYSLVRNLLGDDEDLAMANARRIISAERWLHIFIEGKVQRALDYETLMQVLNSFYGIAHFAVTASVLMWLYHRHHDYGIWRTTLLSTTCLALIGYLTFPLAPPRLAPGSGIQDMLAVHGAPWNYDQGPVAKLSNQFAAMPSLHIGWAVWCTAAIWHLAATTPALRRRIIRALAVTYSVTAVVVVVATGNHYFLDVLAGMFVLSLGGLMARQLHKTHRARLHDRQRDEEAAAALAARRQRDEAEASEAVIAAVDGDHVAGVVAAGATGQVDGEATEVRR